MSSTKARWLRVPTGSLEGLYELSHWNQPVDLEAKPVCPCCCQELAPGYDICQWGFLEDSYTSYVLCRPCGKAFELRYFVPTYAVISKKEQRRLGFLPSKKPETNAPSKVGQK